MDLEKVRNYCLSKKGVSEEFPFNENTPVYKVMGKIFCISGFDIPYFINLKCDPEIAVQLREEYEQVQPGYHMNKKLWNSVYFEGKAGDDLIYKWIDDSYELIVNSLKKKEKEKFNKM